MEFNPDFTYMLQGATAEGNVYHKNGTIIHYTYCTSTTPWIIDGNKFDNNLKSVWWITFC
jgi:hypothetical protein